MMTRVMRDPQLIRGSLAIDAAMLSQSHHVLNGCMNV